MINILGQFELRIGFDDRAGFREGVKGSDFYMLSERLDVDVADGAKRDSSIGFKTLYQAFALNPLIELLLDGDEHLCWYALELNLRGKTNLLTINCLVDRGAFNGVGDEDVTGG